MRSTKKINIEDYPYYFFSDMINIKNFDTNLLNIDKLSFKTVDSVIYNITINTDNKNSFYLIFNKVDGYIEENNEDKYLIFASTDKK